MVDENNFLDKSQFIHKYHTSHPHWEQPNKIIFLTLRIYGSIPKGMPKDTAPNEDKALKYIASDINAQIFSALSIRNIIIERLNQLNNDMCETYAYVIMPTHIHLLLCLHHDYSLQTFIKYLRGYSSVKINRLRNTPGAKVWQKDYIDRMVRNREEYNHYLAYIKNNPSGLPEGTYALGGKELNENIT